MSKYLYNGTDITSIMPNDAVISTVNTNLNNEYILNNYFGNIKSSNWQASTGYVETVNSDDTGNVHLKLGYTIKNKDIYAFGQGVDIRDIYSDGTYTAPNWANHFTCYTAGGGGGGGGGSLRIGNGNGYDGGGGGGGGYNYYRLYKLSGQRTLSVNIGGGGQGGLGSTEGQDGKSGGATYITIDGTNIAVANGGGGGGGANGQTGIPAGGGGTSPSFPTQATLKSEDSAKNNVGGKGTDGQAGNTNQNRVRSSAGDSPFQTKYISTASKGNGGIGGAGSNGDNQFGGIGNGNDGEAGAASIWWFGGYEA